MNQGNLECYKEMPEHRNPFFVPSNSTYGQSVAVQWLARASIKSTVCSGKL